MLINFNITTRNYGLYKTTLFLIVAFVLSVSIYKFRKSIGNPNFSDLFRRIVKRFRRTGYNLDIIRQTACLVFKPIMVADYAALFSCTAVVQA